METQKTLFESNNINWHKYNLAKTQEKRMFYELLHELCQLIPEPNQTNGRPRIKVRDLVFSACLKLYSNYSGRKIMSDLVHAEKAGFISKACHYNTLSDFLNCEASYDLLQRLITITAMPLKLLEDSFSIDASGFGAYQHERWIKAKFKDKRSILMKYMKGHIVIGTRTNVICNCEITPGNWHDAPQAEKLIQKTNDNFNMKEFSGDGAYSSKRILQLVESLGVMPYIPFQSNANPPKNSPKIWKESFEYFKRNQKVFLKHYHKRSNVETTFMMVKQRLGEFLRSKTIIAQRNELLTKFLCHNICCLIAEIFESDVHVNFREEIKKYVDYKPPEPKKEDNSQFYDIRHL